MKAIVVPGVTDLNKGDQALVWESHRLIMDTGHFEKAYILSSGDTPQERESLCAQSEKKGYEFIENILKHPRRGSHNNDEAVSESLFSYLKLVTVGVKDFLSRSFLISISNKPSLVKLFFDKTTVNSLAQIRDCDVIFVKGGGFIHAYGEKTAPYLIWFFLFYVRLGLKLGKKIIFLPNSYGPFEGLTVKDQVKSVFSKLDKVYAREVMSSKKLGELLNEEITVSPDLGFYLKMGDLNKSDKILNQYNLSIEDKIIGITIRPWRFPGKSNPKELYEKYINSVIELTEYILAQGEYKVVFCNQSIGPNSHEDDRNAIKDVLSKISHPDLIWIDENLTCEELKALYSRFYAFVGTRFHSVIFSLTSLVPSIAIGYGGNKAKGIMSDFDLEGFSIQIEDTTGPDLINMFKRTINEHGVIKEKLKQNLDLLNVKRARIIKEIIEVI